MSHHSTRSTAATSNLRAPARRLLPALLAFSVLAALPACSRSTPGASAPTASASAQQRIVDRSATAFEELRKDPRHARMEGYLKDAKGVMIFPRLVKASLIFGGEGGNGVLIARTADGSWSSPAFYSIGSPSLGFQVGYQKATVVLFIMNDATLKRALDSSFSLGAKAGVSIADLDEVGTRGSVMTADIYQVVDTSGAYAGASLDGYVIGSRPRHNQEYYGKAVTPHDILVAGTAEKTDALVLERALTSS